MILYVPSVQVSEERLISLLEQINNQTNKQTKVTVCKFMEQINIITYPRLQILWNKPTSLLSLGCLC
jgi:hypothetical protein